MVAGQRDGFGWTSRYPSIADDLRAPACTSCVIDGDPVILDAEKRPVFDRLRYGN